MGKSSATFLIDRHHWQLLQPELPDPMQTIGPWTLSEADEAADQMSELVANVEPKTRRAALLLDSSLCLAASFQMDSIKQARKREALLYKLEEEIPFAAEDVIADFVRQGTRVFAVAVARRQIVPLLDAMSEKGQQIELIAPIASLAWMQHLSGRNHFAQEAVAWFNKSDKGELTIFESGQPVFWASLPSANGSLSQQVAYNRLRSSENLSLVVYCPNVDSEPKFEYPLAGTKLELRQCDNEREPLNSSAIEALAGVRSGHCAPLIDLSRGLAGIAAGRSPLAGDYGILQVAVMFMLVALLFSNFLLSRKYNGEVDRLIVAQEDLFCTVFPEARLPRGVMSSLQGEHTKLSGARGETDHVVRDESVLPIVHSLLKALPDGMRFRLVDIKVEARELDLSGEVRDFGDADKIAASLRGVGFEVKPPTTRRLPEASVGFRLQATFPPSDAEVTKSE